MDSPSPREFFYLESSHVWGETHVWTSGMAECDLTRDLWVMTTEFVVTTSGVVITPSRVTSGRGCELGHVRKNRHQKCKDTAVFLEVQVSIP
jgi:hypothetical protein